MDPDEGHTVMKVRKLVMLMEIVKMEVYCNNGVMKLLYF